MINREKKPKIQIFQTLSFNSHTVREKRSVRYFQTSIFSQSRGTIFSMSQRLKLSSRLCNIFILLFLSFGIFSFIFPFFTQPQCSIHSREEGRRIKIFVTKKETRWIKLIFDENRVSGKQEWQIQLFFPADAFSLPVVVVRWNTNPPSFLHYMHRCTLPTN